VCSRKIFGTKKEDVAGGWRELHSEEVYGFYSSPHIVRVIKPRRIRRTELAALTGGKGNTDSCGRGNLEEKSLFPNLSVEGMIILRCTLKK
jgi:hypothetical protein